MLIMVGLAMKKKLNIPSEQNVDRLSWPIKITYRCEKKIAEISGMSNAILLICIWYRPAVISKSNYTIKCTWKITSFVINKWPQERCKFINIHLSLTKFAMPSYNHLVYNIDVDNKIMYTRKKQTHWICS